jgi:Glycoside hydrolase 131 catalytic N-terminal domain
MVRSTTQVLYSQNVEPLVSVTGVLPNDVSGQGQFHFGALKKGTGDNLTDVTKEGFQENGINEGVIYGGIFEEDSTGGCVSLSP